MQPQTRHYLSDLLFLYIGIARKPTFGVYKQVSLNYMHTLSYSDWKRTSDRPNEGMPVKNGQRKVSKKIIFFHEKGSRFNSRIISKEVFLIGQVSIKNMG